MEDHSDNAFEAVNKISNYARTVEAIAGDLDAVGLTRPAQSLSWFAAEISKEADVVRRSMALDARQRADDADRATKNMVAAAIASAAGGSKEEI